jgi:hypothetical protein
MCVGLGSGTRYLAEGGRQGVREGGSQAWNRAWGKVEGNTVVDQDVWLE